MITRGLQRHFFLEIFPRTAEVPGVVSNFYKYAELHIKRQEIPV